MKKIIITSVAASLVVGGTLASTSCIGSFSLTNKVLAWNKQVGNKVVNELVFIGFMIIPVYPVGAIADLLVLNSIEFWSGDNPIETSSTETISGSCGDYIVETNPDGYVITSCTDGSVLRLNYDSFTQTWSTPLPDGTEQALVSFIDADHVSMPDIDGTRRIVELSVEGLMAYRDDVINCVLTADNE